MPPLACTRSPTPSLGTTTSNSTAAVVHFKVHVPDEVDFKLEIEFEDDERELEIELKW